MNNPNNINFILTGFGTTERIVSVQQISPNKMRLYVKDNEKVKYIDKDFYPFFYLTDINLLTGFNEKFWHKRAEGNGEYKYICVFEDWSAIWRAIRLINKKLKLDSKQLISFTDIPEIYFRADPINQFLLQSGETFFKQMEFDEVHRMQIDIETYSSKGFSQASRKSDSIIVITLSDNFGWEMVLSGKKMTEKEMLLELIRLINEKDPDIIEGHNIINFDLIYILDRCSLYNIEFKIGRDGSSPLVETSKSASIERSSFDITIAGRQIVDTYHLVLQHDMTKREMEDYSLKSSAKHFGISPNDRIYIPGEKISWYWDNDPEILIEYAKDDVEETRALSNILLPIYFYQAQILPLNFDQVVRAGISNKIESLMVREYLRRKHSLPAPKPGTQTTGGFTALFYSGLFDRIVHADVESLYPSIILNQKIYPRSDELGIFLELLKILTEQRISLKRQMKSESDLSLRSKYDS
ncbi:MAG: DNA polymerase, partial [Ignavibacteria bacterium]|nr:DNA polymerase [Ignavibacteria bacterium]